MIIAVDFDGTCVANDYPNTGTDIGAVPVLQNLVSSGNKIILLTLRSGIDLVNACLWFRQNNIQLHAVNKNREEDNKWSESPKIYADVYIDDKNLGSPLLLNSDKSDKPYVDWAKAEFMLKNLGILNK